ncbi:Planctomycete cytochrome C [Neorhodopirellula lusitana]|uniref:Planctomycete cytochrome C n=2 Tax=Neorhodopirellula lusitana TaxID=445327 RepID=A0ABY1PQ70_9BACT|nr:Planctomycete cytochrome C [Neorhodopirellula lusitana]
MLGQVLSRLAVFALVLVGSNPVASAAGRIDEGVADFLDMNCIGCHDSGSHEGDLDLETLVMELDDPDNFHFWERVFDRVREGEMPPDETLDDDEVSPFLASLHDTLKTADSTRIAAQGRVPARRLTRAQYARNVSGLLAIDMPFDDLLPADSLSDGFDTVSKGQQISAHTMSAYLNAADAALDAAFERSNRESTPDAVRFDWKKLRRDERRTNRMAEGRPEHQDIVSWSTRQNFYGKLTATTVPAAGRYRIRLSVQAVHPPSNGRVWCSVQTGVISGKASTMYWVGSFEATTQEREYEFEAWIRDGHMLRVFPNDRGLRQVPVKMLSKPAGTVEPLGFPGVAIKWIEMQQIFPDRAETRRALFGDLQIRRLSTDDTLATEDEATQLGLGELFEVVSKNPEGDLQGLVHSFAQRAFRRPVTRQELGAYLNFARKRYQSSGSMAEALRAAYRTILCSPRFLYFEESPDRLDEYALASRLSHFLWGVGPDEQLLQLAGAGRLSDPGVLRRQTDRLLNDERSSTFVKEFADQWLMLYEIDSTTPDSQLYPEYDDVLHHTLKQETHAFVKELVQRDLPARNIIDSDFTFLNSRLARHYGIEWPGGIGLRRVELGSSSRRGGIITHASVLKVTANGTTTSPIVRGVWMLERIMGQHVPPPPANVSAVEPDIRGATSIREQLEKHKDLDSCAACHVKMDPPGFALENYDVIGGWRDHYRAVGDTSRKKWSNGVPVDASHQFVTGESFRDVEGMKEILGKHPEQIARSLAMHLTAYSTGAAPTFADREKLDGIVAATKSSDYGVRSIIQELIQSPIFQNK